MQEDRYLASLQTVAHALLGFFAVLARELAVLIGRVGAGVPDDDLTPAVLALWDDPLEEA